MKLENYYISNFKKNSLENFLAFFYFQKLNQKFFRIRKIFLTKKFIKKFLQKNFKKKFSIIFSQKNFSKNFTQNFSKIKIEKKLHVSKNFNARIIKNFIGDCSWNSFHDKILQSENGL